MPCPEILRIPNLLSLSRIALAPVICYSISQDTKTAILVSLALLVVAGITDGLDGYLARRWQCVSRLGTVLDPLADKLLALWLVACLILYRDFPLWLAAVIVGRDLLIIGLGSLLLRGHKITLPSNLTGKYAFTAIVVLLASYIIRFDFGIMLTTWVTMLFIMVSLYSYGRVFMAVRQGKPAPRFKDKLYLKIVRILVTAIFAIVFLISLYRDIIR